MMRVRLTSQDNVLEKVDIKDWRHDGGGSSMELWSRCRQYLSLPQRKSPPYPFHEVPSVLSYYSQPYLRNRSQPRREMAHLRSPYLKSTNISASAKGSRSNPSRGLVRFHLIPLST